MRKRILATLLAVCLVLGIMPEMANAVESDFTIEDGVLIKYTGSDSTVDIPSGVTKIGDRAFYACSRLTSVTIPNGVTNIGYYAFEHCSNLTTIDIPDSVITINSDAFAYCNSLTSITIPSATTDIGRGAFKGCSKLIAIRVASENQAYTSVDGILMTKNADTLIAYPAAKQGPYTVPDNVTNIEDNAFEGCGGLTSVIISDGVISIGNWAFSNCSALTNATIPDTVATIGHSAFYRCNSLSSITVPSGVTNIEDSTFYECSKLTSITLPNTVVSIGTSAFHGCTLLTGLMLPSSVTTIGNTAFRNCTGLICASIPDGVTSIEGSTFYGCTGLASVIIPSSVTSIGSYAFCDCNGLTDVYYAGSAEQWNQIEIDNYGEYNSAIINATKHYNSTGPDDTPDPPTPPTPGDGSIVSLFPTNGAENVAYDHPIFLIEFDREIATTDDMELLADVDLTMDRGFAIYRAADDELVYQSTEDSAYSFLRDIANPAKRVLKVALPDDSSLLEPNRQYYITMNKGFVRFKDGTESPGIKKGVWRVTTAIKYFATEADVTIKTGSDDKPTASVNVLWDDTWFVKDTKTYNHALAATAMALSGAAYVEDENENPQDEAIRSALWEFGFNKIKTFNYHNNGGYVPTKENNDHVAFTFADKEIPIGVEESRHLIAIVIKGTSSDAEWYSNFNMGTGEDHAGFYTAKEELVVKLWEYLRETLNLSNADKDSISFFVTGHSRGAAVANLVAAELSNPSSLYGKAYNVYGYTFAAPAVSINATETGYENIFNIVNGEDFVPRVPLKDWDYRRYGIDLLLPSRSYCGIKGFEEISTMGQYLTIYHDMNTTYQNLTGKNYKSYVDDGVQAVDKLVSNVYDNAPSPDAFYHTDHVLTFAPVLTMGTSSEYFNLLADFLVAKGLNKASPLAKLWTTGTGKYGSITRFFVFNANDILIFSDRVFSAHSMAGYYSWITTDVAPEILYCSQLGSSTEVTYKRVAVKCPVDVYVYDENGNTVASVVDEQVVENTLAVSAEDGEKTIDLPSDQDYSIRIVATDDGTVEYQVEELSANGTGNTILRTVEFNAISIANGDTLNGIIKDDTYTPAPNYALAKNDTTQIYPDYDSYTPPVIDPVVPIIPDSNYPSNNSQPATSYKINFPATTGGKVTATPISAKRGDTVTLTATPAPGYELASLTVTDNRGNELELTDKGGGKYTFTMPASKVTVDAVFQPIPAPEEPLVLWVNPFIDVAEGTWYYDAVKYVSEEGLMNGTGSNLFSPDATTTRAMIWTILARLNGVDTSGGNPWYKKGQDWATANQISDGTAPDASITREQLITMLWRYKGNPNNNADLSRFADSGAVSEWAKDAIEWAVSTDLLQGSGGKLDPTGTATRAQVATILQRYCETLA